MIYIPNIGWFYRSGPYRIGPYSSIGDALAAMRWSRSLVRMEALR